MDGEEKMRARVTLSGQCIYAKRVKRTRITKERKKTAEESALTAILNTAEQIELLYLVKVYRAEEADEL